VRGIIPALLVMAFVKLAVSWHFVRRVPVLKVSMTWAESFREAGGMVRLGLSFMWVGLIATAFVYAANALITQKISLEAVGIYSAALALSGMFVDFVLKAMVADYYPHLTGLAPDHRAMNRLVNEQTEIALLLAVPGLLATMSFAPWIIHVFYTSAFLPSVGLMQWFIMGCLVKVVAWPIGFLPLALGRGGVFVTTQTLHFSIYLILIMVTLPALGLEGVAISFFTVFIIDAVITYAVAYHLTGFNWFSACRRLLLKSLPVFIVLFITVRLLPLWPATILGALVTIASMLLCFRGLIDRVGDDHRMVRAMLRVPGMRTICGTQ